MTEYSVVMTCWNKLDDVTSKCLPTFFQTDADWELVVVDNASGDGTGEWLLEQREHCPQLRPVLLEENAGYAGGLNAGLEIATGEWVCCMNNDIQVVHPMWLQQLFAPAFEDPKRLVGPRFHADNAMTDVGSGPIRYIEGWLVGAHRDVWEKLGGWDATLAPAWFEDVDLSWRAEQAGFELHCNPNVGIIHLWGRTSYRSGLDFHAITAANKKRFSDKYWEVMANVD